MAIDAHSTPAPAVQPGLLRTWTGAVPVPTPALTAETVGMLDAIPPLALQGGGPRARHISTGMHSMGWSRPLASCAVISPHAMVEREVRRLMAILSPNVVPLFGARHG